MSLVRRAHHQSLPHRRAVLVGLLVGEQRRGLVAQLVHQHLQLQNGALLGATVLVVHVGLEQQRVAVDGPVGWVRLRGSEERRLRARAGCRSRSAR